MRSDPTYSHLDNRLHRVGILVRQVDGANDARRLAAVVALARARRAVTGSARRHTRTHTRIEEERSD
jgi:hypothetical protein